jgi:hypothetical protein
MLVLLFNSIFNGILAVMAIVATIFSWKEIQSHKEKENNKLLSQLNRRYLDSQEIQKVVRYLREFDAGEEKPSSYEIELFLRFFEELGVYMRKDNLPIEDVRNFFNYYLEQLYTTERGEELRKQIRYGDIELSYLNDYKEKLGLEYLITK